MSRVLYRHTPFEHISHPAPLVTCNVSRLRVSSDGQVASMAFSSAGDSWNALSSTASLSPSTVSDCGAGSEQTCRERRTGVSIMCCCHA